MDGWMEGRGGVVGRGEGSTPPSYFFIISCTQEDCGEVVREGTD